MLEIGKSVYERFLLLKLDIWWQQINSYIDQGVVIVYYCIYFFTRSKNVVTINIFLAFFFSFVTLHVSHDDS